MLLQQTPNGVAHDHRVTCQQYLDGPSIPNEKEQECSYTISNSRLFVRWGKDRVPSRVKAQGILGCSTTGGGKMKKSVDIFWFGESGPVWVEAARTMERAQACVDALPLKASGGYAVVDHRTGNSMS